MNRTQVYLTEAELELLDEAGKATGANRSELIRRAIRAAYGHSARRAQTAEERRANIMAAVGIWADRPFTGEEYARAIRSGDMNANLRKLGVF
jgi:Arc/MetJ-type ribon-helix-helix transcriptional regulator